MSKKYTVALFSPNHNANSETFIRAHRDKIDANVDFYTNGNLPTWFDGRPMLSIKSRIKYFVFRRTKKYKKLSLSEFLLTRSLLTRNTDVVLCEFGNCANASLNVIKNTKLPLFVYFHGFDLSVRDILEENNYYKNVIEYAKTIFVVSRDQEKKILELGARKEQVILNPCAPNDTYFDITREPKQQLFIAAGRFVNKKAPHLTLLAFMGVLKKYPKAKLIIAGDGFLHQVVRDLAVYYGIQNNIQLPGSFDSVQFQEWLSRASAFVQHSVTAENGDQEGTPVAVLEAMAAGVPVVSTKHAGVKDIIEDNTTGYLVNEYDVDTMTDKMIAVLDDPATAKKVGLAGREFVANNLTMSTHIKKINTAIQTGLTMNNRVETNSTSFISAE